jgi:hypothetical protein
MPSGLKAAIDTLDLVAIALVAGAFVLGVAGLVLSRSRGYLGLGVTGTRRIMAAALGMVALGAVNGILSAVLRMGRAW